MSAALLVLPDCLIIIFSWLLKRKIEFSREFFVSLEKLIYYVLFPAMLFQSIVYMPISMSTAAEFFFAAAAVVACGIVLSWLAWPILRARRQLTDFNRHPVFGTYATHLAIAHLLRQHDSTHTHP
jgi:hypothetical protein